MLLFLSAALLIARPAELTASEVLDNVRRAVHYTEYTRHPRGLNIHGTIKVYGEPGTTTLLYSPTGKFLKSSLLKTISPHPQMTAFDGSTTWTSDWSGATSTDDPAGRGERRFSVESQTHGWLDPARGYTTKVVQATDKTVVVELTTSDEYASAAVTVDRSTWLPQSMTILGSSVPKVITLADYRPELGILLPHSIVGKRGPSTDTMSITSVEEAPTFVRDPYSMLPWRAADTTFDPSKPATLEVRAAQSGHLLVHPRVNGKDVGWFILDTGAGAMVIDKRTAADLKLPTVGEQPLEGVGGIVMGQFRPVAEFTLGQATIKDLLFSELELSGLDGAFGVKIAGIAGYDLFRRTVVEIDQAGAAVSLTDPARYKLTGASWQPMGLANRTPYVVAEFGKNRRGPFRLDSGAMDTVIFNSSAVRKYRLTEGLQLTTGQIGGVGGNTTVSKGAIESFTLGGKTFPKPAVVFSQATSGATSDPFLIGTIGHPFMMPFKLIFDYGSSRMAFVPKESHP